MFVLHEPPKLQILYESLEKSIPESLKVRELGETWERGVKCGSIDSGFRTCPGQIKIQIWSQIPSAGMVLIPGSGTYFSPSSSSSSPSPLPLLPCLPSLFFFFILPPSSSPPPSSSSSAASSFSSFFGLLKLVQIHSTAISSRIPYLLRAIAIPAFLQYY